jgi:predicted RNA binding protein YcfA (HicA-like mRNA interferase family)
MPPVPLARPREVIRAFEKSGWRVVRRLAQRGAFGVTEAPAGSKLEAVSSKERQP